jgi:hypothetical protein
LDALSYRPVTNSPFGHSPSFVFKLDYMRSGIAPAGMLQTANPALE